MNNQSTTVPAKQPAAPPEAVLMQMIGGCFVTQAGYVAAKLGIADLLAGEPQSAASLAKETDTDARSLYRILRTLASFGIFREVAPQTFANTPASELLCTDAPGSFRDMTVWMGEEAHWRVYGHLLHSVKTGEAAWKHVHGQPVFPYLFETDRELGEIFNRAMTSFSGTVIPAVLKAYDFSGFETLADVAGGYGHLLAGILKKYPDMKGVLFDLPAVIDEATLLDKEGVANRVQIVRGDFFESVPVKADAYLLKHIIHDWYDEQNTVILKNIRAEMPDDAKVLVIDTVIPEDNEPHFGKIMDMEMLLSPGGVERTETEFRDLFAASGLKLNRIIPTESPMSIVEAVKA